MRSRFARKNRSCADISAISSNQTYRNPPGKKTPTLPAPMFPFPMFCLEEWLKIQTQAGAELQSRSMGRKSRMLGSQIKGTWSTLSLSPPLFSPPRLCFLVTARDEQLNTFPRVLKGELVTAGKCFRPGLKDNSGQKPLGNEGQTSFPVTKPGESGIIPPFDLSSGCSGAAGDSADPTWVH